MTRHQWRTAGESRGPTLIGVVEGIPAGLRLDVERIDAELARLQPVFANELRAIDAEARAMELPLVTIPDTAIGE